MLILVMRYISADQIFSGSGYLPNDTVLALSNDGTFHETLNKDQVDELLIEHHKGIVCPGFINTHCHLELSHLKNKIDRLTGIVDFGLAVIRHRNAISSEEQKERMNLADKIMWDEGIVAVGDISNTELSASVKSSSSLYYHTFVELIALNPERAKSVFEQGIQILQKFTASGLVASFAPHAPYSASVQLIQEILNDCRANSLPTSIHNQESEAENEFFRDKHGDYLRLYNTLGIALDHFNPTGKSSLQTLASILNPDVKTLLVHNTFTKQNDLEFLKNLQPKLYWCLCPNANLYIENALPDVPMLLRNACAITLGTDSLASNNNLSIISEINTILNQQAQVPLEVLLEAATSTGAKFLGIDDRFGSLIPDRPCGINLIEGNSGNYSVKKLA
jgi:cytosine/adenosine deaminase-related metal-dependent hydrolase